MDEATGYRERRSMLLPATIWTRGCEPGASTVRPDGCMDLIWNGSGIFVAGPDTAPHTYRADRPETLTAIRLSPGIAPILLGLPASELRDQRVDLADIWQRSADRWEDLVADAREVGTTLESLASAALTGGGGVPGWMEPALAAVRIGTPIADVADGLGLSARQLQRRCSDHFGYGPKMLQRILRVDDATRSLRSGMPLTPTAHRHGYADYSHMFRDFRSVAGAAPADFVPSARSIGTPIHDSAAQMSTGLPSGSSTTAYRWPQNASNGAR